MSNHNMGIVKNEPKRQNRVVAINGSSKLPLNIKEKKVKHKKEVLAPNTLRSSWSHHHKCTYLPKCHFGPKMLAQSLK